MARILFALLVTFQVLDVATTSYGLSVSGIYEGNPAIAWCQHALGVWWWLPKLGVVLLAARFLGRSAWPLAVVAGITCVFALNNLLWLAVA